MQNDRELFEEAGRARDKAFAPGAMPVKYKLLIALALDASKGAVDGITSLAKQALNAGATKEEVFETVRITGYITGVASIYTAARGLSGIEFKG